MIIKCKIVRMVHRNDSYQILGAIPTEENSNIVLNKYNNFTIKDPLLMLSENKEYELELDEIDSKYGKSYVVKSIPSLEMTDSESITDEMEYNILCEITTPDLATEINKSYPNYIRMVLHGEQDKIDLKKIKGVKEVRHNLFCRLINERFKYYYILEQNKQYELEIKDCKELCVEYGTIERINEVLEKIPYYALIQVCKKSFDKADRILKSIRSDLIESDQRTEFLMLDVLEKNQYEGSTCMNANEMAEYCNGVDSKLIKKLKSVAISSELIYYDDATKNIAIMSTYLAECNIAQFVKEKIKNSIKLDWDWSKFTEIKDGTLTEEQSNVLKTFCENSFSILDASSGCVDKDTEFFNGIEWKPISEYKEGDKVLQYNQDGTSELVFPQYYHKLPCDSLWNIKTKYGINQTLSDEHRIVYLYQNKRNGKSRLEEKTLKEVRELQEKNKNGFEGKFITSFKHNGKGIDLTDEEIRIMCAVICDGSFYNKAKSHNESYMRCRFHIKKERKKERLRHLFTNANIEWREKESTKEGYTDLYINSPRREKEFSEYWYNCTNHQLQIICDEILNWDGSINYTKNGTMRKRFSTSVKKTADFIQFAFSGCGYRSRILTRDRRGNKKTGAKYIQKSIEYELSITNSNLCSITSGEENKPKFTQVKTLDGYKYCFTVPSHMLILRRENCIFITGNCGKTSVVKSVLDMCDEYEYSYCCLAFTGKASSRLSEQTGRPSSTIHRKTMSGEIYEDIIIIDEYSMLSVDLLNMVISAIQNPNTRVFLVGDTQQIPSLGMGRVAKDLLESEYVPKCTLTHCFRFDEGGASYVSTLTRQGKFYLTDEESMRNEVILGKNKDYTFIKSDGTVNQIINTYLKLIAEGVKKEDICILTPMNIHEFGAININNLIQSEINPPKANENTMKTVHNKIDITLRKNDLIMNIKNDYNALPLESYKMMFDEWGDTEFTEADVPNISIFNGQIGKVLSINEKILTAQIEEEIVVFNKMKCYNLLLSYATNPFKFQGSSCKYIINIILPQHKRMLNRQLLYTAQTRQEKCLIEIGDINTIKDAIAQLGDDNRETMLKKLLEEGQENNESTKSGTDC